MKTSVLSFKRVGKFLDWLVSGKRPSHDQFKVRIMKSENRFDWYHEVVGYLVTVTPSFKGLYEVVTHNDLRLFISKANCRKATPNEIKYFKVLPY